MANTNTTEKVVKITKKDMFNLLDALVLASGHEEKAALHNFILHEIELLNKKTSKAKEAKEKGVNEDIAVLALDILKDFGEPVTVTEMMTDSRLKDFTYEVKVKGGTETKVLTNQKLSSIVSKLEKEGMIIRTEEKKKAYFSIPKTVEAESEPETEKTNEEIEQEEAASE